LESPPRRRGGPPVRTRAIRIPAILYAPSGSGATPAPAPTFTQVGQALLVLGAFSRRDSPRRLEGSKVVVAVAPMPKSCTSSLRAFEVDEMMRGEGEPVASGTPPGCSRRGKHRNRWYRGAQPPATVSDTFSVLEGESAMVFGSSLSFHPSQDSHCSPRSPDTGGDDTTRRRHPLGRSPSAVHRGCRGSGGRRPGGVPGRG